jgi:enoyl-CoA hydratase
VSGEVVECEIADGIALVTINNPPVNAQSPEFHLQMMETFDRISDLPEVRVAVLTAAGRVFSAGADLKVRAGRSRRGEPGGQWAHLRQGRETYHCVAECKKPVIAAINGPALGAGLAVVASCDILIASEKASLGLPEIDVGVIGGARHAMRLFSHSTLRRMVLTGYRMPAAELLRLGVIEAVVPPDDLIPTAMRMAGEIAANPTAAVAAARHTVNTISEMNLRDGVRFEQSMVAELAVRDNPGAA